MELRPETVALARQLRDDGRSYREISADLFAAGHMTVNGKPFAASSIMTMLS